MMSFFFYLFFMFVIVNLIDNFLLKKLIFQNLCFLMSFILMMSYGFKCLNWIKINFFFGLNFYSFSLIILSLWIIGLMILSLNETLIWMNLCLNLFFMLLMMLILSFMSMNMLLFFFFFEISLVPTFFIVIFWGMNLGRLFAGYYLLFYTMFFSMPLLILLMYMNYSLGSLNFIIMEFMSIKFNNLMLIILMIPFLVKIPMFFMHSWLLKAHVEAPVFGSMILAALMLKLGTYGLLRIFFIFYDLIVNISYYFISFCLLGSVILSIVCLRQVDMKILVAYSSVVHMNMVIASMMTMFKISILGAYLMMIAHGLCSSGLFYLVNICYERSYSRLMLINKGMLNMMPSMSLLWFLLCSSNMAAPLSLNLIGEVFLLMGLISWELKLMVLMMMICFFSFIYSLYLFSNVQHGLIFFFKINMFNSGKLIEFLNLLLHWIPLNLLIMNLIIFMN